VTFKGHSGDRNRATGLWFRKEEAIGAYSSLPDSAEPLTEFRHSGWWDSTAF